MALISKKLSIRYLLQTFVIGFVLALINGSVQAFFLDDSSPALVRWAYGFFSLFLLGFGLITYTHWALLRPLHLLHRSLGQVDVSDLTASEQVDLRATNLKWEFAEIAALFHELLKALQFRHREVLVTRTDLSRLNNNLDAELDLRRLQLESRVAASFQQNKLNALGEMAAGIAHEINNPLAILVGRTEQLREVLKREGSTGPKQESILLSIEKTLFRIQEAVLDLELIASSPSHEEVRKIPLSRLLKRLNKVVSNRYQTQEISFQPDIEADLEIEGREMELSQALLYLFENASEAAQKSDSKWVRVELKRNEDHRCTIVIIDSGCGVEEALRDKLFQPFFTTKDEGRGMGLSLAKSVIESHHGNLAFTFNHGNTTVTINLPLRQQESVAA